MPRVPGEHHQTSPSPHYHNRNMVHVTNMWCACIPCVYTRVCVCACACVRACVCVDMTPPPTVSVLYCSPLKWIPPPPSPSWLLPSLDSEYSPNYTQGHTGTYRHTDKHVHMYTCTHTCTQDMHTRHVHPLMYALHSYIRSSCIVPSTVYVNGSNHWIVRQPD